MTVSINLNDIPTNEQNYLCNHWPETRRALEILARLADEANESVEHILAQGDAAVRRLQKGQPSRRRALRLHNSQDGHH